MTAKWQAGHTYPPGSLVKPTSVAAPVLGQVANGNFASGATGWTFTGGVVYVSTGGYGDNGGCCYAPMGTTGGIALNDTHLPVAVGQTFTATCNIQQGASDVDHTRGWVLVRFYDDTDTQIGPDYNGPVVNDGRNGAWHPSTLGVSVPAGATYAKAGIGLYQNSNDPIWADDLSVSSTTPSIPAGLVYKATQAAPGKSASTEPTWPGNLTTTVTDNQVTWQGVIASQIVWKAIPVALSGSTEPTWADTNGSLVPDGAMSWTTLTPMVADASCPHSKQVLIAAEKVFAGDVDITRYSATANPLDWHTSNDAGFIPHGLNAVQETSITALALYRSNVALFTASCLQLWKADPDPAAIVILDTVESVGTTYNRAAVPVEQDVFFTSDMGIRSISVSASQQAMGEGDIGNPMDAIVRTLVGPDVTPLAAFFPNLGQSLFFFGNQVVVLFKNKLAKMTGWALYQLPITVTAVAVLDGDLYVRDATAIYWFQVGSRADYGSSFPVVLEWQYLNFGTPGTTKTFLGVSMESDAIATVSAAYDVQVPTRRTGEKRLPRASEAFLSMSFVAKQAAFRLTLDSAEMDSFTRMNVYFRDGGAL